MRVKRPAPDITRGYIPLEGESVARSRGEKAPGDLNESFMIGPLDVADDEYLFRSRRGKALRPELVAAAAGRLQEAGAPITGRCRTWRGRSCGSSRSGSTCRSGSSTTRSTAISAVCACATTRQPTAARRGPAPRRRAHRLWQPDDPEGGGEARRPAGVEQGGRMGRRADRAGLLRGQYRRPDGALDERPLGLDPAPGRQPAFGAGADSRRQSLVFFHNPNYDADSPAWRPAARQARHPNMRPRPPATISAPSSCGRKHTERSGGGAAAKF